MGVANVRFEVRDRVLYVYDLLNSHPEGITIKDIIQEIYADFGVYVNRKSVYKDIEAVSLYLPILKEKRSDHKTYWRKMKEEDFRYEED